MKTPQKLNKKSPIFSNKFFLQVERILYFSLENLCILFLCMTNVLLKIAVNNAVFLAPGGCFELFVVRVSL